MTNVDRILTLNFLILIALLPLVWIRFGSLAPAHFAALFLLLNIALRPNTLQIVKNIFNAGYFIWIPMILLVTIEFVYLVRFSPPQDGFFIIKQLSYLFLAFISAVSAVIMIQSRTFGYVYYGPAISSLSLVAFLSFGLYQVGVDPAVQFQLAMQYNDPNIVIYPIFKSVFSIENEEARSNLRHGIALAMLSIAVVGWLAFQYVPKKNLWNRTVVYTGISLIAFFVVFSFSRSAWLAMALMIVVMVIPIASGSRRTVVFLGGFVIAVLLTIIVGSTLPAASLVIDRIEQTQSYDGRLDAMERHWIAISEYPLLGHPRIDEFVRAHNLVLDAWSGMGILGLLASLALVIGVIRFLFRLEVQATTVTRPWNLQFAGAAALICPMLTRMFTAPNGFPEIGIWWGCGVAIAIFAVVAPLATQSRHIGPSSDRKIANAATA